MDHLVRPATLYRRYPDAFASEAAMRFFLHDKRAELVAHGAVFKNGRAVYIDTERLLDYLRRRNSNA